MTTDAQRDPRTQPVAGDVIRSKYQTKRVEHVVGPWVLLMQVNSFHADTIPEHGWRKSWEKLAAYRACARGKSATIIRRGDQS